MHGAIQTCFENHKLWLVTPKLICLYIKTPYLKTEMSLKHY